MRARLKMNTQCNLSSEILRIQFLDRTVAILGSANLTEGGLTRNTELGFEVECGRATRIESDLDQIWNSIRAGAQYRWS